MAKPASRPTKRGGSSAFPAMLIGLSIGAILAAIVAIWVTGNNPFKSIVPQPAPVAAPAPPSKPEAAPNFDFYEVLPGDAPAPAPAAQDKPVIPEVFYLQAGAFQSPADADNLKAQLALLGLEAVIQTSDQGDKGVFHRVRVGPLSTMDEVERTRSLLTLNNIPVTLVRETPQSQETP